MVNWSELPIDIFDLIHGKLSIPYYIRFGAICKQWNLALELKYRCPPKPQSPWLMLPGESNTTAEFFSVADNKVYQIPCPKPMIRRRICIGSSHGWLITVDESSNMHLMNPLTGAQFPLPPVTTLPFVEGVHDSQGRADSTAIDRRPPHTYSLQDARRIMFHKAIISAAPDEGSGFAVMMICNIWRALAFARAEDKAWTYIDTPDSFTDVIYHRDKFYTISYLGTAGAWEPHGLSCKPKVIPVDFEGQELLGYTMYLVESLDG
ncbi:hypothetical protein C4D60_Mb05t24170 [Musa balbisiana]|uniref:KIB1-4 beta-propeller domain-containing protein n=1 Tax=Musa balbisiana TaxID=52838 RepID=A0A4S8JYI9_MUSBA|nr:hypothetical protein C4D60_Mb05t24170 [Musa balbisiana]